MNDSYLNDEDYSGVQSVEDIKRILREAQTPGPNKYNFDSAGNEVRELPARAGVWHVSCGRACHAACANTHLHACLTTCAHTQTHPRQAGYEDNMIDDAIEDEFNENEQSFNPKQYTHQQQQQQQRVAGAVNTAQ
jgi:hypothetical protein